MSSCTLAVVVNGSIYESFAEDLFASAEQFFHPTDEVELLMLPGRSGWPDATMYRWHVLRDHMPKTDFVFLSDADMLFVAPVGPEILPRYEITATQHPGYVGQPRAVFPYETHDGSAAYIPEYEGDQYFCGGFVGGCRLPVLSLAQQIATIIDSDHEWGHIPRWHDESALNKVLSTASPEVVLPPSMCYPDSDSWYLTFWKERYERKLIALDKTAEQRVGR